MHLYSKTIFYLFTLILSVNEPIGENSVGIRSVGFLKGVYKYKRIDTYICDTYTYYNDTYIVHTGQ